MSSMSTGKDKGKGGAFITETETFMVTDNLHVIPNLPTTVFELFEKLGISDLNAVDEIDLNIGYKEMLTLLKCSQHCNSPLTATFLSKESNFECLVNYEIGNSYENGTGKVEETAKETVTIRLVIQKSNNKILFAHAEEKFVDFLFSMLTFPLGGVVRLLSGTTSLGSVENLYNSLSTLKLERHLKSQDLKSMLVIPQLAALHLFKNHVFPFSEVEYFLYTSRSQYSIYQSLILYKAATSSNQTCVKLSLKDPKFKGQYKRPSMFIVADDMDVIPPSLFSLLSCLIPSKTINIAI